MNSLKRFLDSISSTTIIWFIMGSFCLLSNMQSTTPILSFAGWIFQGIALFLTIKNFLTLTKRENYLLKNGIKHARWDEESLENLGNLRTCVSANKIKIFLTAFFHTLFLVYAVGLFAFLTAKKTGIFDTTAILLIILAMLLGLLPLRHLGDFIKYYDNGFIFCNDIYLYQKVGDISFKGAHSSHALTRSLILINKAVLDVSYLKSPKRNYYETYFKRAIDPMQNQTGR